MVFSSHVFLFWFLPLVLAIYYTAPRQGRHLLLTAASYAFYGWANPLFVVLMATSTAIDFVCGLVIASGRRRKGALIVSIVSNLSLLGLLQVLQLRCRQSYNATLDLALGLDATGRWEHRTPSCRCRSESASTRSSR